MADKVFIYIPWMNFFDIRFPSFVLAVLKRYSEM